MNLYNMTSNAYLNLKSGNYLEAIKQYYILSNNISTTCFKYNIDYCCRELNKKPEKFEKIDINNIQQLDIFYDNSFFYKKLEKSYAKVSIIMPLFNKEKYLKRSINSILSQQNVDIELIIVDDGSTDGSYYIAYDYSKKFKNIILIPLQKNFGCYYARNIGIEYSTSRFFTVVDADDIISPFYIYRLAKSLNESNNKIGARAKLRRWDEKFSTPITDSKYGENSILFKRDVIDTIGYYDSVKFSGDTEFRRRAESVYGEHCFNYINDEMYAVRTVPNSLTTSKQGNMIKIIDNKYIIELSQQRKEYLHSFSSWHNKIKKKELNPKIHFPLLKRNFNIKSKEIMASPSLGNKIIGQMATYSKRVKYIEDSINSIIDQLDELIIYLNNCNTNLKIFNHKKIKIFESKKYAGDLRDVGKFYQLDRFTNSYLFTLDDDIIYPSNYVSRMIASIESFNRMAIVCVHGTNINDISNYKNFKSRKTYPFYLEYNGGFVDIAGTGTTAFHSDTIKLSHIDFPKYKYSDLYFSGFAHKNNIPLFCIQRENGWLKKSIDHDEDSYYIKTKKNPNAYFEVFNEIKPYIKKLIVDYKEYKVI